MTIGFILRYDPSNPVVKYSGSLHERMYPWMCEDARTADLVLVRTRSHCRFARPLIHFVPYLLR